MKKEIIGTLEYNEKFDDWTFETEDNSYSADVASALDELLDVTTCKGERYKITIESLNNNLATANGYKGVKFKTHFFEQIIAVNANSTATFDVDISSWGVTNFIYAIAQIQSRTLSLYIDYNNSNKSKIRFIVSNNSSSVYTGGIYPYCLFVFN